MFDQSGAVIYLSSRHPESRRKGSIVGSKPSSSSLLKAVSEQLIQRPLVRLAPCITIGWSEISSYSSNLIIFMHDSFHTFKVPSHNQLFENSKVSSHSSKFGSLKIILELSKFNQSLTSEPWHLVFQCLV